MSDFVEFPSLSQTSNVGFIEEAAPKNSELEERVSSAVKPAFEKINIGFQVLQLGLKRAGVYVKEITGHANEAKEIQALLKKNIDLNSKLSVIGDKEEMTISTELRDLSRALREKGIQTFSEDKKVLSREEIAEIKTNIGMQIDQLKTEMQVIFSSHIQPKISEMNSLLETLKMIEKYQTKLLDAIIANSTKR